MDAGHIVSLLVIFTVGGTAAQTVQISPSPREESYVGGSLKLTCSNNGIGSFFTNSWFRALNEIGTVRFKDNVCNKFGDLRNESLYMVECVNDETVRLTVKDIQLHNHEEVWYCSQTIDGTPYTSNNTTVFVKVRVTSVTLTTPISSTVTVPENTLLNFSCTTSKSRPAPTISWYLEQGTSATDDDTLISIGVSQSPAAGSEGYDATNGLLTYRPSKDANGKYVSCQSRGDDQYNVLSNRKILLNVTYKPVSGPLIQSYNNNTIYNAIDNKEQSLTCMAIGGNPLATLSWTCFTGNEENLSSGKNVSTRWTWRTSSNGTCTCEATHLGVDEAVVLNVKILSPPTTPLFMLHSRTFQGSTTVKILRDSNTEPIICLASSYPSPDRYTWTYDVQSATLSQVSSLNPSKITADGRYWCQVRNTMTPTQGSVEYGNSSTYINIQRLFSPTKPVLKYHNESGTTLIGSIQVVKGDNFSMHCSSSGKPSPGYLWTGDRRNIQYQLITVSSISQDRIYTCKATNTMDPTYLEPVTHSASTTISVVVLSPPATPITTYHYSQSGSTSVTSTLNVIKGKSFSITCNATGVPVPSLKWTGPKLSDSGILMFTSIQQSQDGIYNCTARNTMNRTIGQQIVGTSTSSLRIQVLYAPVVKQLNDQPIVEGNTLSVECKSTPGNPTITKYTWMRKLNSSSGNDWQTIPQSSVNGDVLVKQNINRNDAGIYRCTASNVMKPTAENQETGSSSETFVLNVFYKTSISSFIDVNHPNTQKVTVQENSTINLHCKVDSNPGSTIRIDKDGVTKASNQSTKDISYSHPKVTCDTAGIYQCVGFNEHNLEATKPYEDLRLFVTCSPRLRPQEDFRSNVTSALNEEARIKITLLAYPVPKESDYTWWKWNGETWNEIKSDDNIKINTSGLDSSLVFHSVLESDYQKYRVNVSSDLKPFNQEFFLNPYGKPKAPENVKIIDKSVKQSSAVITWNPGFNGGPEQTFVVLYKKTGASTWLYATKDDEKTTSMNVTLTGLADGTKYELQMYSRNILGNSTITELDTFTTLEKTSEEPGPAALIGGAIGGSVAVIILIAVIVVLLRRSKVKKGKSKNANDGSDRKRVYEDDDDDDGMQDNPMYVSAGPQNAGANSSGGAVEYSTVNKAAKAIDIVNDNEYAVVSKPKQAKTKPVKKEKSKQGFFKDKKGKKMAQEGDIYENSPANEMKVVAKKDETIYEDTESSAPKKNVNKDGLIYADLTFNDQPKGQRKLVIHGLDSMTEYVEVDFTKKADPLPDSDDENIPAKN